MACSRRGALVALAGLSASTVLLSGSVSRYRPRRFDRVTVSVSGTDALWVGAFGFRSEARAFRGHDLIGFGPKEFVAPPDLRDHDDVETLYAPIELIAAPMAGFDEDERMEATLTSGDEMLDTGTVTEPDDAISLRFE